MSMSSASRLHELATSPLNGKVAGAHALALSQIRNGLQHETESILTLGLNAKPEAVAALSETIKPLVSQLQLLNDDWETQMTAVTTALELTLPHPVTAAVDLKPDQPLTTVGLSQQASFDLPEALGGGVLIVQGWQGKGIFPLD